MAAIFSRLQCVKVQESLWYFLPLCQVSVEFHFLHNVPYWKLQYNSFLYHQGAIATLSGKLKLLDPSQLEQIEGRMYSLSQKINQISEKKETIENNDKTSKVSDGIEKSWK